MIENESVDYKKLRIFQTKYYRLYNGTRPLSFASISLALASLIQF